MPYKVGGRAEPSSTSAGITRGVDVSTSAEALHFLNRTELS
jgi:hypothetical protein